MTAAIFSASAQQLVPNPEGSTQGKSVYWTASGAFYVDQQLDALSRLMFPNNDQRRFQWLSDRIIEQQDREKGTSYSLRVR